LREVRRSVLAERHSGHDEQATAAAALGGGIEAVVQETALRTRTNVLRLVDSTIVVGALANDAATERFILPAVAGLRRLVPDDELVRRRAAGEPLRALARDYGIAHTTLSRYFARSAAVQQLGVLARKPVRAGKPPGHSARAPSKRRHPCVARVEELATLAAIRCPVHGKQITVRVLVTTNKSRIGASPCCNQAKELLLAARQAADIGGRDRSSHNDD
jgi:hypothetical protein